MKCKVCGNQADHEQYVAREMMLGIRKLFTYFQCRNCECLQISAIPSDIQNYYPDKYHSFQRISQPNPVKQFLVRKRNQYAIFENTLLGKFLYSKNPEPAIRSLSNLSINLDTRILDIGCGSGQLLYSLYNLGFKNLAGIDPFNKDDIVVGNDVHIWKKDIHHVEGEWDLIMMHHSFEHAPDPQEVLNSIAQLLSPSGSCLLRIPVVNSYAWERFQEDWVQLDAPRHYFLYSAKSLELLAERAGLELGKIIYDSTSFQFWGSIQYKNDIPLNDSRSYSVNPGQSMFSKKEIRDFSNRSEELNKQMKGDQAVFILQKK